VGWQWPHTQRFHPKYLIVHTSDGLHDGGRIARLDLPARSDETAIGANAIFPFTEKAWSGDAVFGFLHKLYFRKMIALGVPLTARDARAFDCP
jgi:hypothetical protein